MKEKKEAVQETQENKAGGDKIEMHADAQQQSRESPDETELLQNELEKKEAVINDYTTHLKRLQADFENYIKRAEKEKQEVQEFASQKLVLGLLSIKDEFEIALSQIKNADAALYSGMKMIFDNLRKTIEEHGVKEIKAQGALFDPYFHEAVSFVLSQEHPENTIMEEFQKGYTMKGKVLRYSKVVVARNGDKEGNSFRYAGVNDNGEAEVKNNKG